MSEFTKEEQARCGGCPRCDEDARDKGEPCCTWAWQIVVTSKGKCLIRTALVAGRQTLAHLIRGAIDVINANSPDETMAAIEDIRRALPEELNDEVRKPTPTTKIDLDKMFEFEINGDHYAIKPYFNAGADEGVEIQKRVSEPRPGFSEWDHVADVPHSHAAGFYDEGGLFEAAIDYLVNEFYGSCDLEISTSTPAYIEGYYIDFDGEKHSLSLGICGGQDTSEGSSLDEELKVGKYLVNVISEGDEYA